MRCHIRIRNASVKLKSKNVVPPGGWYFEQGRYRIQGETWAALVANVAAHRTSNGLPVGNVADEVENQICTRHPQFCSLPEQPTVHESPGFWASVKNCTTALIKLGLGKDDLVSQAEANRRGLICAGCHNNVERSGGCAKCQKALADMFGGSVVGSRSTPHDPRLKACSICNCENRLKIWFPLSALQIDDSNRNAFPAFCWLKDQA